MNSFTPLSKKRARPAAQDRFSFNWIEVFAVPVTTSIMEAQPVVLVLLFGSLLFTGQSDAFPLVEGSIILLVLSLCWWAMLVRQVIQPRLGEKWANLLYLPGLFVAFAVIVGTHPAFLDDVPQIVFCAALGVWLWRRSIARVEKGLQEEQLTASFKVGFLVLLALLFFAVVYPEPTYKVLLTVLAYALPIFFLSSLFALSFSHLGAIKREYLRRSVGSSQADPTRVWGMMLLFLWLATVVLTIILEAAAFDPLVIVFSPLVSALRAIWNWFLSLIPSQPSPPRHHPKSLPEGKPYEPPHLHSYLNPYSAILQLILVIVMVLLAIFVLVVLLLLLRESLRKRKSASDEDEVRESLSIRSILRARRKKRQKRPKVALEPLDPLSARARYRELLQAMARHGDDLERRPDETPTEYQTRLLTLIKDAPHDEGWDNEILVDDAILDELTRAYTLERYGGKITEHSKQDYLQRWVPHLVKRLMGSMTKHTVL